jgi:predicted NBD/HSP70 family sugar kinase
MTRVALERMSRMTKKHKVRGMPRIDTTDIRASSSRTARDMNRDLILGLIRLRQPISRASLARFTGLQRSTVSEIAQQLISEKWIREGAIGLVPRGRRPTLLELNSLLAVVAVDIHPLQTTVVVSDVNGRFVAQERIPIASLPEKAVEQLARCIKRMQGACSDMAFMGIGISIPGRLDPKLQKVLFAPNLKWQGFDLKGAMELATGLSVELENDANACLLAEMWFGEMEGVHDAVMIAIDEGVGTGILANGHLIRGSSGMAGEFGHISLDPAGPLCGCGNNGCWETFASTQAAVRFYNKLSRRGKEVTAQELLRLGVEGNPRALQAFQRQARQIGRGIRAVVAALSPEIIFIAGDVTALWDNLKPEIQAELEEHPLGGPTPKLLPAHDSGVARLRGACALVLHRSMGREHVWGKATAH